MDLKRCEPTLVWSRRGKTHWYCPHCGLRDVDTAGHFPGLIYAPVCKAAFVPLWFPELGNVIADGFNRIGVTRERWMRLTGRPCGCEARRRLLNQIGWRIAYAAFYTFGYRRRARYRVVETIRGERVVERIGNPKDHGRLHGCGC